MAALMIAFILLAFVAVEVWLAWRDAGIGALTPQPAAPARSATCWDCGGFLLPDDRRYHPGHVWARVIGDDTVEVGLDDFARGLIGDAEEVELPAPGSSLLQGETGFRVGTAGRWAPLLSPVDGEVVETNRLLLAAPRAAIDDCYGQGWLCRVRARNLPLTLRNLLTGGVARRWMEEESAQLREAIETSPDGLLADGGLLASGFGLHLDPATWQRLVDRSLARRDDGSDPGENRS